MQVDRLQFLALTSFIAVGCASSNARDLKQITVVDLPPAPAKSVAPTAVVPTALNAPTGAGLPTNEEDVPFATVEASGTLRGAPGGIGGMGPTPRKVPRVREGAAIVNGRLPPEVIQRIVRQNFGRFRMCYESGLKRDPTIEGKVAVRFVIDTNGEVSSVSDAGSTMPDKSIVSCVQRALGGLSFPMPEGGIVTVVFPIVFSLP